MAMRYKLKFPSTESLEAALAVEIAEVHPVVVNRKRAYIAIEPAAADHRELTFESARQAERQVEVLASEYAAQIVVDQQYDLEQVHPHILFEVAQDQEQASLDDVLNMNRAPGAWPSSTGDGVTIAIVDTGVDGSHPEFPPEKRAGGWAPPMDNPWTDWQGHGTMCACIAAGTRAAGGRYDGVAPGAKIMSCKTHFYDSELGAIYDTLAERAAKGEIIVASNSFGLKTGRAPAADPNSDFLPALEDAIASGVFVVFSAGNYHALAEGRPNACSPTSIWLYKSREDVLTVATCRLDGSMWHYSSRGPGQHFGNSGTNAKPDVTAPTPANGRILYGSREAVLADGWGTSGACPQVAGLAALLLASSPGMDRGRLRDIIRGSSRTLGHAPECEGRGLIDCTAALAMI